MKSSFGAENIIFGHISPMRVFGGFFVPCIGLEGAFPLPYANGHARKSMHEDFNGDSANVTARPRYVDWRHFRREKTVESAIDVTIPTGMLQLAMKS